MATPFNNRNSFNRLSNTTQRGRRSQVSIRYVDKVKEVDIKPIKLNYPDVIRKEEEVKPLVLDYSSRTKKNLSSSTKIKGNSNNGGGTFTFNITWNFSKQPTASDSDTSIVPVTAFPLDGVVQGNTRDRPRINTFREDGEFLNFLSAGYGYQIETGGVAGAMDTAPWGNRASVTETLVTDADKGQIVGIDIFTVDWFPDPVTNPHISEWTKTSTGNPTEVKFQKIFADPGIYDITINIYKPNGYNILLTGGDPTSVTIANADSSVFNDTFSKTTVDGQVRYAVASTRYIFFDTGTSKWSLFNASSIISTLPASVTESDGFWSSNAWTGFLTNATYTLN